MNAVGRLAMRHEGDYWNAYYAVPDTMEGAIWLGSIAMAGVAGGERQKQRKDVFFAMMQDMVADIIEKRTGTRPTFPMGAQRAPEHERSKS